MRLEAGRIWPVWARSLGAMVEAGAVARFVCPACRRLYDVDLDTLVALKGRGWSLIERRARCKASKCRARGPFAAAPGPAQPFILLTGAESAPAWLTGTTPRDHDPPPDPNPPAPPGIDPIRWAYADATGRKRLVREARG